MPREKIGSYGIYNATPLALGDGEGASPALNSRGELILGGGGGVVTGATALQSAAAATGNGTALNVTGYNVATAEVTGTFVGTITWEGSRDGGTTYYSIDATAIGGSVATTATTTGLYTLSVKALTHIRARVSAYTSGSITVAANLSISTPLNQNHATTLSTLLAGEDPTNGVTAHVRKPLAVTTYTPDLDTSAALEASSVTKASPGVLYGFSCANTNAAARWIQFFNSTTVPADTTVPFLEYSVPAEGTYALYFEQGIPFSTGIAWCISSTNGAKTVGGSEMLANVSYK